MTEVLKKVETYQSHLWNGFALFYVALSIALLTLSPFEFEAFKASEFWVWRFSFEDFSRNILLFFPFGLLLRHSYRWSHKSAFLMGLLLSGCVEVGQLFIVERTSNVVDLISNSSGALLGSLIYQGIFHSSAYVLTLPLLFMLVPLCWAIAIVASFRTAFVWAMVPCMVAGLTLFRVIPLSALRKRTALGIWVVAAVLPLLNASLSLGSILLAGIPAVLYGISKVKKSHLPITVVALLCTSFAVVLQQTYVWYFSIENWVWIFERHLSWIIVLLSVMTTGSSLAWYHAEQSIVPDKAL